MSSAFPLLFLEEEKVKRARKRSRKAEDIL
jgi:hypothetical protein